ncbi:hypothetical protein FRC14_007224 [Serendipita sp. 396]|nr:hypothetical protein FRC14_007224 [Serendipita sp. 396]KAG8828426.1 hypothetical protein FRC19_006524 [Serendipita sp. 401]KAG9058097.1 hypothetical protein FS842_001678 [Serendipita sp. 407]
MNSNHVLIGNGRLPSEILSLLFEHYLDEESPFHPVETLLLVCKAWNRTAAHHWPIWATYRITLGTRHITKLWLRRIPPRLKRSGSEHPLHIDIRYAEDPRCHNHSSEMSSPRLDVKENVPRLLETFAGKNGANCRRWKLLRLTIDSRETIPFGFPFIKSMKHSLDPLTYPMPLLTSLHLRLCAGSGATLFPSLPSVQSIILDNCCMPHYPDMSSAKEVHVLKGRFGEDTDPDPSFDAPRVEYLRLGSSVYDIVRPCQYPSLSTLCIDGHRWIMGLEKAYMPRLENLHIRFDTAQTVFGAHRLSNLNQIHELHLFGRFFGGFATDEVHVAVSRLLDACTDLRILCIDSNVLSIFLLRWFAWKQLFEEHSTVQVFLVKSRGPMVAEEKPVSEERQILVGDEDAVSSLKLAMERPPVVVLRSSSPSGMVKRRRNKWRLTRLLKGFGRWCKRPVSRFY